MKKLISKIVSAVLCGAIFFGVSAAAGCKKQPEYAAEQDKYLFGMCELTSETMPSAVDSGVTNEWTAKKMGELGVKTARVWMHHTNILYRAEKSDELYLNKNVAEKYHDYLSALKAAGVERILAMSHTFIHPYGYVGDETSVPDPYDDGETYLRFLKMYEKAYALIAEEFPEIGFFEPGNEWDDEEQGIYLHRAGWSGKGDGANTYSAKEAGYIAADMCYYANQGVKSKNPQAKIVSPGTTYMESGKTFLEAMYSSVQERRHPTGEEYANTNYNDYWQIVAWHPYLQPALEKDEDEAAIEEWTKYNLGWHDILVKYGDGEKTMWATEVGFTDDRYKGSGGQETITQRMKMMLDSVKQNMPWVETFFYFRLATCEEHLISSYENGFGLFYSPNHADTAKQSAPKPIAKMLYAYFNGKESTETTFSR